MRRIVRIISLVFIAGGWASVCFGQQDPVVKRLFLVGDAGQLGEAGHHPVCDWLKAHINWDDSSNVLVYLGDNIYPQGMPADGSSKVEAARKIMDYEVSVVAGKQARAFFVPGNHDWKQGKVGGWEQLKNEETYLGSLGLSNVQLLPTGGCPGPVAVPLGDKVVLVCMDSQWWLQDDKDRPGEQSACDCKDEKSVINALRDIVSIYPDRLIVLAMHHPLYTHGKHGGYYTLKQHIFPLTDLSDGLFIPLPLVGSIYPVSRGVFGNVQDTKNPKYKDLRRQVEDIIRGHSNIVDVAGHDHSLQLLEHDSVYYVVSGAGSKESRVRMGKHSLMAEEEIGFATIAVHASGKSEIEFFTPGATGLDKPFYTTALAPLRPKMELPEVVKRFPDSVTRLLLGNNYRNEWALPIRVKVFDMTGWTPIQRGGGMETRGLRMVNAQGVSYALRGVKKYVTDGALPVSLAGDQFVKDLVTDGVSASYPYAALSIPPFAQALHVPHATPILVYMPDDPRLGRFRQDYGNLFAMLEEHEPGNGKKTFNMFDLEIMLKADNDNQIDQPATLRARLLDMFVMDFDRHEDQWRWLLEDNGKSKLLAPVPRDRDQPFFVNQGVLPRFAGSNWASPQLQGFRPHARDISTYNYNARNFDHNYMTELTEADWKQAAEVALTALTDSLIDSAMRMQPVEIKGYTQASITAKLKERKKYFEEEMMTYYRFLSKQVTIYGSDKKELFDVERSGSDSVTVTIYKINKDGKVKQRLYHRVFLSEVTKEVRLYGLGGDDQFHIHGEGGGAITVRIIGGPGNDSYKNEAKAPAGKTKIYDLSTEKNSFTGDGSYRAFLSKDPAVNATNKLGFKYNVVAPLLSVSYNPDDGVYLGAGFKWTTQGFHKDPYKTVTTLSVAHSLATKAYDFRYGFEAIEAIGKLDLLVNADIKAPNNTVNFFGFGNETIYDKNEKDGIRYYRARYDSYDFDLLLRKRFGTVFSIAAGPAFEYFRLDSAENFDRFVNQTNFNGLDGSTLYLDKTYVGGRADVIVDNRDDKVEPSRGIFWQTHFGSYGGVNDESHAYSRLNTDLAVYSSFNTRANLVIANRVGWGKSFGNYEFYQAQFLGATENLRGYHKYRFTGDEAFYHNIDLRLKVANFNTYFFPGTFGLLVFNDVGRVWEHGQSSDQWHDGYGGGFWISPLQKLVFSASYGQGTDGGVFLFKLGFQY
jgi:Omp85 superfamily domain